MHSKQRRIANATQLLTQCRSKYIISVSNIGGNSMAKGLPDSKKYIKEKQAPLRFGADGKFRILHLTDVHEVDPEMDDEEDR